MFSARTYLVYIAAAIGALTMVTGASAATATQQTFCPAGQWAYAYFGAGPGTYYKKATQHNVVTKQTVTSGWSYAFTCPSLSSCTDTVPVKPSGVNWTVEFVSINGPTPRSIYHWCLSTNAPPPAPPPMTVSADSGQ